MRFGGTATSGGGGGGGGRRGREMERLWGRLDHGEEEK